MKTVENFILGLDDRQKAIVSFLHRHFTQHRDLIPKISFNIPMYYKKSGVCYLNPIKNEGIELVFVNRVIDYPMNKDCFRLKEGRKSPELSFLIWKKFPSDQLMKLYRKP